MQLAATPDAAGEIVTAAFSQAHTNCETPQIDWDLQVNLYCGQANAKLLYLVHFWQFKNTSTNVCRALACDSPVI